MVNFNYLFKELPESATISCTFCEEFSNRKDNIEFESVS